MIILLTNDDGIRADGLAALAEAAADLGEPRVVAPMSEQSGASHSITLSEPLRTAPVDRGGKRFGVGVQGTPADCVKLGLRELLPEPPGLVLSGVNWGPNLGIHMLYSGTVSAAVEGAMQGVPSVAVSLGWSEEPDFHTAARMGVAVARHALTLAERADPDSGWTPLFSVSVPACPKDQIKGFRMARQSTAIWTETYERREDPRGRGYYWITASEGADEIEPGTDRRAVEDGYVAVVPLEYDLTYREAVDGSLGSATGDLDELAGIGE